MLKVPVLLELKSDKTENRILVFTAHRLFLITAKVPARIDHHFHYLGESSFTNYKPSWAVVVGQLEERSLLTPEIHGSNPIIGKILSTYCIIEKTKIKKKRPGMAHL